MNTCSECHNFEMIEVGPYSDDPKRPFCVKHDSFIDGWSSNPEIPEWCPLIKKDVDRNRYKPCPNCKSYNLKDCYIYIKCLDCGMTGPKMNDGDYDDHTDYIDHENAIKAWNRLKR